MSRDTTRRDVVKKITIVVGGAVMLIALPSQWTKPVVRSIVAPAHAALSVAAPTTTLGPT
ncbi:twin-arginine translocation signal domain-containing protein [Bradyrhizobium sp.]|uniref:twin-arginine translocation signal domain-containing protein n=1 Tax=Bradyrhizobium sp. TaxID=376 RepID=UPI001D49C5B6|nr:twin-arginine translocation signal domain-containing protein [Bradyrhizobium sp.]MBI5321079.1 twin-arginine translocation signal domain-containing protein [Bradyrhizobium sp.]